MTDFSLIYLDTAPIIYYLERNEQFYETIRDFLAASEAHYVTSVVTVEEFLSGAYRRSDADAAARFDEFLSLFQVDVHAIDREIAEKAARIRANYAGFKSMDALQLAAAITAGCDMFLTNDRQLRQFSEIECLTMDQIR